MGLPTRHYIRRRRGSQVVHLRFAQGQRCAQVCNHGADNPNSTTSSGAVMVETTYQAGMEAPTCVNDVSVRRETFPHSANWEPADPIRTTTVPMHHVTTTTNNSQPQQQQHTTTNHKHYQRSQPPTTNTTTYEYWQTIVTTQALRTNSVLLRQRTTWRRGANRLAVCVKWESCQ